MSELSDKLVEDTNSFFEGNYEVSSGDKVPDVDDIALGNSGKEMDLAMLFVDIRESTKIVGGFRRQTAAKMYKSFLSGVSRIARRNNGEIRSFNGDGVLVVFFGDSKCTNACKTSLNIYWFVEKVLKPKMETYFSSNKQQQDMQFECGIGIDVGKVLIIRGGIKGSNNNDLVWVGNATNRSVKLSDVSHGCYHTHISKEVFKIMDKSVRYTEKDGKEVSMWYVHGYSDITEDEIYSSSWWWEP